MCPYSSGEKWINVKENHPDLWQRALDLEDAYFNDRPERYRGLRKDGLRLRDPMEKFEASKCDSGGCFI